MLRVYKRRSHCVDATQFFCNKNSFIHGFILCHFFWSRQYFRRVGWKDGSQQLSCILTADSQAPCKWTYTIHFIIYLETELTEVRSRKSHHQLHSYSNVWKFTLDMIYCKAKISWPTLNGGGQSETVSFHPNFSLEHTNNVFKIYVTDYN